MHRGQSHKLRFWVSKRHFFPFLHSINTGFLFIFFNFCDCWEQNHQDKYPELMIEQQALTPPLKMRPQRKQRRSVSWDKSQRFFSSLLITSCGGAVYGEMGCGVTALDQVFISFACSIYNNIQWHSGRDWLQQPGLMKLIPSPQGAAHKALVPPLQREIKRH